MPVVPRFFAPCPRAKRPLAVSGGPSLRWAMVLSALLWVQAWALGLHGAWAQPLARGQVQDASYSLALSPQAVAATDWATAPTSLAAEPEEGPQAASASMPPFDQALASDAPQAQLPGQAEVQTGSRYGNSRIDNLRLMYTPHDGLYLYTAIDLAFPALVQDALEQGIPAYFFAQTRVVQPRWWWFDEEAAVQNRFWRLSYQPLTRKWRIQSSTISSEQTDQALGLAQSFDSLQAALVRIEHINNWKIADARDLRAGQDYDVEFTLGLDRSRVPRPLLISEGARSFWDMQLKWRQRFSVPE